MTTAALERALAAVRAGAAGPAEGVFGPGSVTWRVDREAALFLGAGRALLLQLAHPWVAAGVAEHSRTLADPLGRFHRTFDAMFTLVFGTVDQALATARGLHRGHAAVQGFLPTAAWPFPAGSAYRADDPGALAWVHATLAETALLVHDLVLPPLAAADRERYWTEQRHFAGLFGIPGDTLPPGWGDFAAYNEGMHRSPTLTVSAEARRAGLGLLRGAGGAWLKAPGWYMALTAHLLPEQIREGFGLPYGVAERHAAWRALGRARRVYPALPARLRHVGPYQEALARLAGRRPGPAVRVLNRAWIGRPSIER